MKFLENCKYTLKNAIYPNKKQYFFALKISLLIMSLVGGVGFLMHLVFTFLLKYL